jgi:hypothetical protein
MHVTTIRFVNSRGGINGSATRRSTATKQHERDRRHREEAEHALVGPALLTLLEADHQGGDRHRQQRRPHVVEAGVPARERELQRVVAHHHHDQRQRHVEVEDPRPRPLLDDEPADERPSSAEPTNANVK